MQSLDDLLHTLRFRSRVTAAFELREPWGIAYPAVARSCEFHYVASGSASLLVEGETAINLGAGDLAMVIARPHAVTDSRRSAPKDVHALLRAAGESCASGASYRLGGAGAPASVVSGRFSFDDFDTHPLFRLLPASIVIRAEERVGIDWLESTLGFLTSEATSERPGANAILDRLCDVLFLQALRGWIQRDAAPVGWSAAARDSAVSAVLDLIHREPGAPWTVTLLARRVAMSRSSFAERFQRIMGESPSSYLTGWRMHLAAVMLRERQASVAAVAERVGYESEASFAKAFKRRIGVAPGSFRRVPTTF